MQIYLPLGLGVLALIALLAIALFSPGAVGASTLADASLVMVLGQVMVLGLIPLALLAALGAGVWWLIREAPPVIRRVAFFMTRVESQTHEVARFARSPSLALRGLGRLALRLARVGVGQVSKRI